MKLFSARVTAMQRVGDFVGQPFLVFHAEEPESLCSNLVTSIQADYNEPRTWLIFPRKALDLS